jgi:hypothetical protein
VTPDESLTDELASLLGLSSAKGTVPAFVLAKAEDSFVDFEKLFASMDEGYNHHNDPKDFGASYALVKKDQAFSR